MEFNKGDLLEFQKKFECDRFSCDTALSNYMRNKAKEYGEWDSVRFSYSAAGGGGHSEDPRVADKVARYLEATRVRWEKHQEFVAHQLEQQQNYIDNNGYSDEFMASLSVIEASLPPEFRPTLRQTLLTPQPILPFDMTHQHMSHLLARSDFDNASLGLAYFNSKFADSDPYILVEVFAHHTSFIGGQFWDHSNFKARPRNGGPSRLFFVEVFDSRFVPFCCMLDGIGRTCGCAFCPNAVVHPEAGGFMVGKPPPQREQACPTQ